MLRRKLGALQEEVPESLTKAQSKQKFSTEVKVFNIINSEPPVLWGLVSDLILKMIWIKVN